MLIKPLYYLCRIHHLSVIDKLGAAQNNSAGTFNLIIEKLSEIFIIKLCFVRIHNSRSTVNNNIFKTEIHYSLNNIGKLTHSRRLNDYTIRRISIDNFFQCRTEISHERTADASGIHFFYIYSRILKKPVVYANLSEFILYKNALLTLKSLFQKFSDKSSLPCPQKS